MLGNHAHHVKIKGELKTSRPWQVWSGLFIFWQEGLSEARAGTEHVLYVPERAHLLQVSCVLSACTRWSHYGAALCLVGWRQEPGPLQCDWWILSEVPSFSSSSSFWGLGDLVGLGVVFLKIKSTQSSFKAEPFDLLCFSFRNKRL